MELIIYSPTENQFIKEIDFNFEEIKQEMTVRLAKYQDLVYTESSIKEAKTDRATLNKFKEAIENKRKEVKKQCLAPYEEFERKIKELVALIDQPILAIDGQVKSFEQQKKDDKLEQIQAYYNEHIGILGPILPFQRLFNEKWLNATSKLTDIYATIDAALEKTTSDLQIIANLESEFELQMKDIYLKTLDLSAALNEKTRLEEHKARLEEYQKQQQAVVEEVAEPAKATSIEHSEPELMQMDFRVWATQDQLHKLKDFLKQNNIKYGRAN